MLLVLGFGVCCTSGFEDVTDDCVGEDCSWKDSFMDSLLEEEEPALSLLQVGAIAIPKDVHHAKEDQSTDSKGDHQNAPCEKNHTLSLQQELDTTTHGKKAHHIGTDHDVVFDSANKSVLEGLDAHNHTGRLQQDQIVSLNLAEVLKRVDIGNKPSAGVQYLEISSTGPAIVLDPTEVTDTSRTNVATRQSNSTHVTTITLGSNGSSMDYGPQLTNNTKQLDIAVTSEVSALKAHAPLGSWMLEAMVHRAFHLLVIALLSAVLLYIHFGPPSTRKSLLTTKGFNADKNSTEVLQEGVANSIPSVGQNGDAAVLDARLVLPSRETWYVEKLDGILETHGIFEILRISAGMSLQAKISSYTSHSGPSRSLEIFNGKSLVSRVCSSSRAQPKAAHRLQQDEPSTLRLSVLDAKYKHIGQLRFVTATHFEFLRNAEVIASLDIDAAGHLEISTAGGNRMAGASYDSGRLGISVNAGSDTGLILSLILASVILGGADQLLKQ